MTIKFSLNEDDLLQFFLFTATQNNALKKKLNFGKYLLAIGSLSFAILFFVGKNNFLGLYFGLFSAVILLFYDRYYKWRYATNYKKYIARQLHDKFGQESELTLNDDHFHAKERDGEGSLPFDQVVQFSETSAYFYMKIAAGNTIIIPKRVIDEPSSFAKALLSKGFIIDQQLNWKW